MTKIYLICLLVGLCIGQLFFKKAMMFKLLIGLGMGAFLALVITVIFIMGGDK